VLDSDILGFSSNDPHYTSILQVAQFSPACRIEAAIYHQAPPKRPLLSDASQRQKVSCIAIVKCK
jgi:hypothetical protein